MFSPPATALRDLGLDCTDEELFSYFLEMIFGSPVPCNVIAEVNPFLCEPSNLHGKGYVLLDYHISQCCIKYWYLKKAISPHKINHCWMPI